MKARKCPTCGKAKPFTASNPFRPFCSERCKVIDLGAWADEKYSVAGESVEPNVKPDSENPDKDGSTFLH
jgi:endogenous inhibitor of DNA gyrase (YacG/DUF329 family)